MPATAFWETSAERQKVNKMSEKLFDSKVTSLTSKMGGRGRVEVASHGLPLTIK